MSAKDRAERLETLLRNAREWLSHIPEAWGICESIDAELARRDPLRKDLYADDGTYIGTFIENEPGKLSPRS